MLDKLGNVGAGKAHSDNLCHCTKDYVHFPMRRSAPDLGKQGGSREPIEAKSEMTNKKKTGRPPYGAVKLWTRMPRADHIVMKKALFLRSLHPARFGKSYCGSSKLNATRIVMNSSRTESLLYFFDH